MRLQSTRLVYLSPTETFQRVLSDLTEYRDDFPQGVGEREERGVPGVEVLEVELGPALLPQQVAAQLRLSGRESGGQGQEVTAVLRLPLFRDCQL